MHSEKGYQHAMRRGSSPPTNVRTGVQERHADSPQPRGGLGKPLFAPSPRALLVRAGEPGSFI